MWVASNGNEVIVKLLLEYGAEPKATDNSSQTSLSLAAEKGHEAVVKLLLEAKSDGDFTA